MKRYVLLCLGLLLLAACRKDDLVICYPTATAAFADITAAAPPTQSFAFNLGQPQTLRTTRGTIIRFAANAFVLPDGSPATGNATLRVRELHTVGDIFLAGMHTNLSRFSNQLLVSAGEFNLQAWQGNTRRNLAGGAGPRRRSHRGAGAVAGQPHSPERGRHRRRHVFVEPAVCRQRRRSPGGGSRLVGLASRAPGHPKHLESAAPIQWLLYGHAAAGLH